MWAVCIVVASPAFDEDLGFVQRIEEFPVQQLIPQLPVEGLDIPVLPRTARLDEYGRNLMPTLGTLNTFLRLCQTNHDSAGFINSTKQSQVSR